jgi:hypothetical protein
MRVARTHIAVFLSLVITIPVFAQQTASSSPQSALRDVQALAAIQNAVVAMAPTPPSDSTAMGHVTIVAGSETSQGTVKILTRATTQTSIQFQTPSQTWSIIFSGGEANRVESGVATVLPLELAATSQSLYFPLPYLSGLLGNPDYSLQYVGQESVGAMLANHVRVQNTFNSQPLYQPLSEFAIADVWLDSSSALPLKISTTRRYGGGSSPKIPISVTYANYQTVSGVRYPFTIQEYITETLWATTSIESVTFNTGLTDANFAVVQGGN